MTGDTWLAVGSRVRLRRLAERDLPLTLAWRNDDRSRQWFKDSRLLQRDAHFEWFRRFSAAQGHDLMLVAETLDGRVVAQLSIYNVDLSARSAEVGRFLSDPELRGRGFFREALVLMIKFSFQNLMFENLHLEVMADNTRARRLYESVGFGHVTEEAGLVAMRLMASNFAVDSESP
jgi:RimJ/RimL family protein N-acetyltransferase